MHTRDFGRANAVTPPDTGSLPACFNKYVEQAEPRQLVCCARAPSLWDSRTQCGRYQRCRRIRRTQHSAPRERGREQRHRGRQGAQQEKGAVPGDGISICMIDPDNGDVQRPADRQKPAAWPSFKSRLSDWRGPRLVWYARFSEATIHPFLSYHCLLVISLASRLGSCQRKALHSQTGAAAGQPTSPSPVWAPNHGASNVCAPALTQCLAGNLHACSLHYNALSSNWQLVCICPALSQLVK